MPILADEERAEIERLNGLTAKDAQDVRDMLKAFRRMQFPLQADILLVEAKIDALVAILIERRVFTEVAWAQARGTEVASLRHDLDAKFTAEKQAKEAS